MKAKTRVSFFAELLGWVATIVVVGLGLRLALTLFNLTFNFSATPLGRLLNEGELAERIADVSPFGIARQLAIVVAIAAIIVVAQRAKRRGEEPFDRSQQ